MLVGWLLSLGIMLSVAAAPLKAQSGWTTISPSGGTFSTSTVNVTIEFCAELAPLDQSTFSVGLNGDDVTANFTFQWVYSGVPSECYWNQGFARATGTVTLTPGSNTLATMISDVDFNDIDSYPAYYTYSGTGSAEAPMDVMVSPKGLSVGITPGGSETRRFYVINPRTDQRTVTVTASCTGSATCSFSSTQRVIAGKDSTAIDVAYSASGAWGAAGQLRLQAVDQGNSAADTGWMNVAVGPSAETSLSGIVSPSLIRRDLCLSVAAGDAASVECGDLRLVHALPETRVMGISRAPLLTYSSQQASPFVLVPANVTISTTLPTTVTGTLRVNGAQVDSRSWNGAEWSSSGQTRRITTGFDASGYAAGVYPYELEVRRVTGGVSTLHELITGDLVVVNRSASPLGAGWWLAGVEELRHATGNRKLWVGGDGSALVFSYMGVVGVDSVWTAPRADRADTLRYSAGYYRRMLGDGGQVLFNAAGQHYQTRHRLADYHASLYRTTFSYDGNGRLSRIDLPTPSAGVQSYQLFYNLTSGTLDSIQAPATPGAARTTRMSMSNGRLMSITDPGLPAVSFDYLAGTNRVRLRTNRRGYQDQYEYDAGARVSVVRRNATVAPEVTSIQSLESRGFGGAGANSAVSAAKAYTRIDGPRGDVADSTNFWLNGYGSVRRVRDALGHESTTQYGDANWPALATQHWNTVGQETRAWIRGDRPLPDSIVSYGPYGDGRNPTTRYTWHPVLDVPTQIIAPDSSVTSYAYDVHGLRISEQRGTSVSRQVVFGYNAEFQLDSIREPGLAAERLSYDGQGNVRKLRSPAGRLTLSFHDVIGRDTLVLTPTTAVSATDSTQLQSAGMRQRMLYDGAGRPWKTISIGPAMTHSITPYTSVPAETLVVENTYDAESNLTALTRTSLPDSTEVGSVTTYREYDWANRVTSGEDGTRTFDAAGNPTIWITRRLDTVRTSFDALNRAIRRVIPSRFYPQVTTCTYPASTYCSRMPYYGSLLVEGDVHWFGYDATGGIATAYNRYARVGRTYYPGGQLRSDSSRVRAYDAPLNGTGGLTTTGPNFDVYKYGYEVGYDLNGRRSWLGLTGAAGPLTRYYYSKQSAMLDSLRDMQGNLFGFSYNDRSQLTQLTSPGSVVETLGYEADGWLSQRSIAAPYGTVLSETLTMDGRGKVTSASTSGIVGTGARAAYSGLGNLVASEWTRSLVPQETEHWRLDALGNPYWYRRYTDGPDPETRYSYESGSHALVSTRSRNPDICGSMAVWTEEVAYDYDMAGSGTRELGTMYSDAQCIQSPIRTRDTRSYYSADGKLRVFQRAIDASIAGQRRVYEEYRYDALGRRVFLRSRPDSACSGTYCNDLDATERYFWDGDQLLIEDRSDAASHGGRVVYTHGGAIDRPLALYKDGTAVVPHATWRGVDVSGTFSDGTSAQYSIEWPGQSMYAYLNTPPHDRQSWWGSLIRASQDNSGLMYRRNRYYDPATGRFTQEDPIGLAGGLNLYGYAGGDPVSFSDPFGLSSCPVNDPCPDPVGQMIADVNAGMARALTDLANKTLEVTAGIVNMTGLGDFFTSMGLNPNVKSASGRALAGASAASALLMTPEGAVGAHIGIAEGKAALSSLMGGEYRVMAGAGTGSAFRAAESLGGRAADWQYVASKQVLEINGFKWQAHWAVNSATGETALAKLKAVGFAR